MSNYDSLKLENQLCFPLYACSKEIIKKYRPYLEALDLTYTQYITMLVMWENDVMNVKELGEKLYLDSGTLTPLLKKLENKELITRTRSSIDERSVDIKLTAKGKKMRDSALNIPKVISNSIKLSEEEKNIFYSLIEKIMTNID